MVEVYFDTDERDRTSLRFQRKLAVLEERMAPLREAIRLCHEKKDNTFLLAFRVWVADMKQRLHQHRPCEAKVPLELMEARKLDHQVVELDKENRVSGYIDGKLYLLFDPTLV